LSEIKNPSSSFYLVYDNAAIVAYLKLNIGIAQTEKLLENSMEIERIYVRQAAQRKKIGQFLLQKAIDLAQQQELKAVWLGVWEHNKKAIGFYRKNGFEVFDHHVFVLGNDHQTDLLMKKTV
jgi:ribosomal protein S18 acetylase RimI-like enzyme